MRVLQIIRGNANSTSSEGSYLENAALFDFEWQALPTWDVFGGT